MMQEENLASHAGNETPAGNASNAGAAVPASNAGMDRNAGWNMLTSFMNRMKEKEQNGTWQSYRNTNADDEEEEDG
ncbi:MULTISPECIES: hypothetical protein [Actinotignum]|uniref:hypothetical protein n=1 Tax=Actinotignum TaxID=1653174 RepID=UPI00117761FD|nr:MULTISPECIES: hypothetical protein [Actinotignum]MDY5127760.1 hypothetical protein [Actinotignum sp. SLA_B059]MDY5157654.1 hypothetical protein [Actinotignum timonense]